MAPSPGIHGISWTQSLTCDVAAVREVTRELCEFLKEQGLGPDEVASWELLCAEAGNNAVQYVQPAATSLPVVISARVTGEAVELQIVDHTAGFDFPEHPQLPDDLSEHGRGLFLIRSLTDQATYLRGRHENRLILVRHRRGLAAPDSPGSTASTADPAGCEYILKTMSEELVACYESLSAIFRFTAEINQGGQDARFIGRWLTELCTVCGADWWVLRLAETGTTTPVAFASSGGEQFNPVYLDPSQSESVEAHAARGRQDVWLDPSVPLQPGDPLRRFGDSPSGLCHPIYVNSALLGVLSIGRQGSTVPFTAGQVSIIHTFADFLGIQMHNALIQAEQVRNQLVNRDLEIAATIQRSLLPTRLPKPAGFRVAGHSASANHVGGDFFDVLELSDGRLLFAIADVMGKGVPAAMFAAIFRGHLRSRLELAPTPGSFLTWLNHALFQDLDRVDMFLTAQLVFLDLEKRELWLASAGHCPLLLGGRNAPIRKFGADGPPLGVSADASWEERRLPLPEDSYVVLFTDGLIEARDPDGNLLGMERVKTCLNQAIQRRASANATHDALLALAARFRSGLTATDDLTFLILAPDDPPSNP